MGQFETGRDVVAIVGAGQMGAAVGRRLRESGARVLTSLRGRSDESAERVRQAGLEVVNEDAAMVDDADFILSIVPPGAAIEVAKRFSRLRGRRDGKPLFVECNAISPATTRSAEEIIGAESFIDAGIIGGPPASGTNDPAKGPRFYASGPNAHHLMHLAKYGIDVAILEAPVGAASGLKLAYAGLTKGFTALGAAIVGAAARDGLTDALRTELARTQPNFLTRLERSLPDMLPKAYRWIAEMEQISEFVGDSTDGAAIYLGAARLFEAIAAELSDGQRDGRISRLTHFCGPTK
jgi:3-hydroxyisobutyrate dehydrogenase-like beta-hydroxyacid dehydrogenase